MVNMNDMMKKILKEDKMGECSIKMDFLLNDIVDNTKIIKDCIIYDKEGDLEEKINFDKMKQFVGDMTGCEVSCNELRYNRHIISCWRYLELAKQLNQMLINKTKKRKIIVYLSLYEEEFELRFHIYREDEGLWLDEDLNRYDIPILYVM